MGDQVYSYSRNNPKGGFYAQYGVVSAELVAPFPQPPLDLEHAGAVPTTGLTALQGIADHLDVQTGEHVMIHGASGAVGTLAIQFAKERGAKVLAVASGPRWDGAGEAARRRRCSGRPQGTTSLWPHSSSRSRASMLCSFWAAATPCCAASMPSAKVADSRIRMAPRPRLKKGTVCESLHMTRKLAFREFEKLNRTVRKANLQVPIAAEFSLDLAAEAHRRFDQGHVLGKIVLLVR
jgi:NADPH2:quinone reductase